MTTFQILGIGAIYQDVMLTVPHFPHEDSKLRATSRKTRLGGNIPNTLGVLSQVLVNEGETINEHRRLVFMGASSDNESSMFLEQELEKRHIKPCVLNRADCKNPPTSYILESAIAHTRTIISHNEVAELSMYEIKDLVHHEFERDLHPNGEAEQNYATPSWIHVDGRNCEELLKFLRLVPHMFIQSETADSQKAWTDEGTISIDFERPGRKGLRELFQFANVAFISKIYANSIATQENTDSNQYLTNVQAVRGFLRETGKELKETAVGYITVGSEGCYVFVAQESVHASAVASLKGGYLENGWLFAHIPVSNDGGTVVETTGAGDTFIAGVIYGLGMLKLDPIKAAKLGNSVAGRKCLQEGFEDVWRDVKFLSYS